MKRFLGLFLGMSLFTTTAVMAAETDYSVELVPNGVVEYNGIDAMNSYSIMYNPMNEDYSAEALGQLYVLPAEDATELDGPFEANIVGDKAYVSVPSMTRDLKYAGDDADQEMYYDLVSDIDSLFNGEDMGIIEEITDQTNMSLSSSSDVYYNDETVDVDLVDMGGDLYVPFRALAEDMGYDIGWNDGMVTYDNDDVSGSFMGNVKNESTTYYANDESKEGMTPININSSLYVPVDMLDFMFDVDSTVDNGDLYLG